LQRNGPFPLEELAIRVRHTILEEFEGRRPSILEVDSLPDNHWLQLPNIGPKVLASMRELARGASRKAGRSSLAGMTDAELNAECDHLNDQRKAIDAQLDFGHLCWIAERCCHSFQNIDLGFCHVGGPA
jgi:hypothetical protein